MSAFVTTARPLACPFLMASENWTLSFCRSFRVSYDIPRHRAICSLVNPCDARVSTLAMISGVISYLGLPILALRCLSCVIFPPLYRYVDILGHKLHGVAVPALGFCRDDSGSAAAEWFVDGPADCRASNYASFGKVNRKRHGMGFVGFQRNPPYRRPCFYFCRIIKEKPLTLGHPVYTLIGR